MLGEGYSTMSNAVRRLKRVLTHLQTVWSIVGITLVLIVFMEIGLRVLFAARDRMTAEPMPDRRIVAEGYGGEAWLVDHYRELGRLQDRWQPYVYFRQKPFRGKTINIGTDGLRATWSAPPLPSDPSGRRSFKILMLGGSSLWGFGARDDQTIPSLLARSLHKQGWRAEIKNLAEIGYVSTQEVIALTRELRAGYRPDLVVFYDGVNDTTSALLEGEPGLTTNEVNRRNEFNLLQSPARLASALVVSLVKDSGSNRFAEMLRHRLVGDTAPPRAVMLKVPDVPEGVVLQFEGNVMLVEALGKSFGFRPLFFWQPTVFTKPALVPVEQEEALRFAWAESFMNQVYDEVRRSPRLKSDPAFHDLSTIFDDIDGLAFIDYCHTTETANARIASEMTATVVKLLSSGVSDGQKSAGVDRERRTDEVE
jgi:lysophospholipase L1-like esterase